MLSKHLISVGVFVGYIVLALLVYGQTLNGGFLVDDWWWAATAKSGGFPLFGGDRIFFRPLASALFVGFWHLFGANPFGYRLASMMFLVLTAWVMRAIWLTLTNNKQPWVGAMAGALFILWPSHSEAVAWISAFSDLLIVLFGAASLWTYLRFLRDSKPIFAVSSASFLVLALLTKEPAVTLPVSVLFLGQVLTPLLPKRKKQLCMGGVSAIALTVTYFLIRRAFLGGQIGGYNGYNLLDVEASLRGWKLTVNLCNLYFPIAKFVAINLSPFIARNLVLIFIVGTGAALLRSLVRTKPATPNQKRLLAAILLAGLIWLVFLLTGAVLAGAVSRLSSSSLLLALPILALLFCYLVVHVGRRWWRDIDPFLSERKLNLSWIPAAILLLLIDLNRPVLNNLDFLVENGAFALFLYVCYLSRPQHLGALNRPDEPMLPKIAYAMFFASIFALLPSIALPIGIDGQQGRFSYLGTFFSVFAMTAAYAVLLKAYDVRRWTTAATAGILFLAAYSNANEWAISGAVSREATAAIKSLLPARRIYVVTAPDSIYAALLFRGGIEQIPFVAGNDRNCQIGADFKIFNLTSDDQVRCEIVAPAVAALEIDRSQERRLEALKLSLDNKDHWFENPNPYVSRFLGFQPTDRALYIDAVGAHLLR